MNTRYKVADIENLKNELELLPETDPENRHIRLREAMKVLAPVLREMRERRGYTNEKLLGVLRERGLHISKSTLADYLRSKRRPPAGPRVGGGEASGSSRRDQPSDTMISPSNPGAIPKQASSPPVAQGPQLPAPSPIAARPSGAQTARQST